MSKKNQNPLHDWVCDTCGRKFEGRRKIPLRCHATPMRPMGSPWKYALEKFYAHAKMKESDYLSDLPDDYWISERVINRLQAIVDSNPKIRWSSSVKSKGPAEVKTYAALQ